MKNGVFSVPGTLVGVHFRNGVYSYTDSASYPRHTTTVQSDIVRKGDRKSPLPFWYKIYRRFNSGLQGCAYGNYTNWDEWSGSYIMCPDNLFGTDAHNSAWSTVQGIAYSKLLDQIRGSTDLSVDAFQLKQTIALPRQALSVVRSMRRIRKLIPSRMLTRAMNLSGSAWLAWVYGVKPTMQSIYDAVKFTSDHYHNELRVFEGKGYHSVPFSGTAVWPDSSWTSEYSGKANYFCTYKVRMKIPDNTLTQAARLSSLNPASIAWELTPWSFVVDWFYDIGGYLRDLETSIAFGSYFQDGFVSTLADISLEINATRIPVPGTKNSGTYCAGARDTIFDRTLLGSLPAPPKPRFTPDLSSGRLLNAAALLSQFLRR